LAIFVVKSGFLGYFLGFSRWFVVGFWFENRKPLGENRWL